MFERIDGMNEVKQAEEAKGSTPEAKGTTLEAKGTTLELMLNQAIRLFCLHQEKRNVTTPKRIRDAFASGYLSALFDNRVRTEETKRPLTSLDESPVSDALGDEDS